MKLLKNSSTHSDSLKKWLLSLGEAVAEALVAGKLGRKCVIWESLEIETLGEDLYLEIAEDQSRHLRFEVALRRQPYDATSTMYHTASLAPDIYFGVSSTNRKTLTQVTKSLAARFPKPEIIPLDKIKSLGIPMNSLYMMYGERGQLSELGVYVSYAPRLDLPPDSVLVGDVTDFFLAIGGSPKAKPKLHKKLTVVLDPRKVIAPSARNFLSLVYCPKCGNDLTPYGSQCNACDWPKGRPSSESDIYGYELSDT